MGTGGNWGIAQGEVRGCEFCLFSRLSLVLDVWCGLGIKEENEGSGGVVGMGWRDGKCMADVGLEDQAGSHRAEAVAAGCAG